MKLVKQVNSSSITWFYYWFKVFSEGQRTKDKLVLFPGSIPRVIGCGLGLIKIPFLPQLLQIVSTPPASVVIENKDGIFFCRKGKDDVIMAAEVYEFQLRSYFESFERGIFVDIWANIGKYTVKVAKQIGKKGRVISIEPEPSSFEVLKLNIKLKS
jgi:hypothetical protein